MNFKYILKSVDSRLINLLVMLINLLIIIDIVVISYLIIFQVSPKVGLYLTIFDLIVCVILIIEFFIRLIVSENKKEYIENHWIDFVASMPYDLILPMVFSSLRYLRVIRIIKVLRVAVLFRRYFRGIGRFIENTSFDKILSGILITIVLFTLLLYLIDPNMDLFESLWFVIVTLTTVGYGDITPQTFNSKIISLILLIVGVFIFSTITGAISSYFNERVFNISKDTEEALDKILNEKITPLNEELKKIHQENQKLHNEIAQLKETINNKK